MATYLQLANRVLRRINETELTSVTGQKGVHAFVLDAINDVIRDVNSAEQEWPFNFSAGSTTLISGVSEYAFDTTIATIDWESFFLSAAELLTNTDFTSNVTSWTDLSTSTGIATWVSTGNGRMDLTGGLSGIGKMTQLITTVTNKKYIIKVKTYGGSVNIKIGTTSDGAEILAATALVIDNLNRGQWNEVTFTATGTTTYITVLNTVNASYQVDSISCKEDFRPKKLVYIPYDTFLITYKEDEAARGVDTYSKPELIYPTLNEKFGVIPVPDLEYVVTYNSWVYPSDLAANATTPNIPDRFTQVIINGVLHLAYFFKEDFEQAAMARRHFEDGLKQMRTQIINKPGHMRGSRYGTKTSRSSRLGI